MRGFIHKMVTGMNDPVRYQLPLGDELFDLNASIGKQLRLTHTGRIHCIHCNRSTKKSYSQGYCYPCFRKLPQCDLCMMSPERCHFEAGTCRDPDFGERFCMQPHIVYLANSSGLKVGITKQANVPTRWIDQGAVQALPMLDVSTRQVAGFAEQAFKQFISDKTHWQQMLKAEDRHIDMTAARTELMQQAKSALSELRSRFGADSINASESTEVCTLRYPVNQYPTKVTGLNFTKTPTVEGRLMGIKGQYLIFDIGVINMRRHTAYELDVTELPDQSGSEPDASTDSSQQSLF